MLLLQKMIRIRNILLIILIVLIVCDSFRWQVRYSSNSRQVSLSKLFGRPKKVVEPSSSEPPQEPLEGEKPKRGRYYIFISF